MTVNVSPLCDSVVLSESGIPALPTSPALHRLFASTVTYVLPQCQCLLLLIDGYSSTYRDLARDGKVGHKTVYGPVN